MEGTIVVVGARGENNNAGAVYIFDTTTRAQTHKIVPSDTQADDRFGRSVGISGSIIVAASASLNCERPGKVYVFDTSGNELQILMSSDGVAGDCFGRSLDIDGNVVVVGAVKRIENSVATGAAYLFFL